MAIDAMPPEHVAAAVASAGVPGLHVVASAADVTRIESTPGCQVRFPDAVRQAVLAFLEDRRGSGHGGEDAPLDLVIDVPEAHGLPASPSEVQAGDVLRGYLQHDAGAEIVLLTPTTVREERYRFLPEYGESLDKNWVFRIILPKTFDLMSWVIVDITGHVPPYAYAIE